MALNTDSTDYLTVRRLWSIMSSFKDKIVTALGKKSDKSSTVSNVAWSSSKLTKTINGTTTDVVSASTLKSAMSLNNVTNDAQVKRSEMGTASGVATLDANGIINTSQLPSYVDDVLEYSAKSQFPATGETGKIYVDTSTNLTWRWSGTTYVEISPSLALGETSSTAYRGDRGKTAYDHSQLTSGNPHNVTATDVKAVSYDTNAQNLTDTQRSNARTNIGAGTSNLALGTSSTTAAKGDHTHTTSIASDSSSGTVVTLAHNTQYKLTAGGTSVLFKTPTDSNTDTKVTQTKDDSGTTAYPLLMAGATDPNGSATTARYDSGVKLTPSTNTISANISGNAATATKINTSAKIGDVDLPVYVDAGGTITPIGHSLNLPTDGTEAQVSVGTDSNNYAYLDATPASGSNKRGVWTVTGGNGSWLAYSDSNGNAHIGNDSSTSITNATGWRSTTKCYVGGIPVNGYTYSNSGTAHTIFYIGKMFGNAYEPTTNDSKNFTALLTVSTLTNLGNNAENRGSGFTAIIQINARQATERHATINVIADDNWPRDYIPTIVCNTEDEDGQTLYRYGICFMDGSDALKSFTYTKFDVASLCECLNWRDDRWFSSSSKLSTMTFFGGERMLIIRDRRPGVTNKNAYLSVRNSDDVYTNLEAWDNSGDVKCGVYAKNGGVTDFICYKASDGKNYFNGTATTATDYNTSSGTIKTTLDGKMATSGSNATSAAGGNIIRAMDDWNIPNENNEAVPAANITSGGTTQGRYTFAKIWNWITSHHQVSILKTSADVYVRVGADTNHGIYLDYDASGTSPTMGLWVRWGGSGSNSKWMAKCDSSGNCTFNGTSESAKELRIPYGSGSAYLQIGVSGSYLALGTNMADGVMVSYAGEASTAAVAGMLGTSSVGSASNPIYLNNGVPTACNWWVS